MAVPIVRTITPILSGPFAETLVEAMLLPRRPGLLKRLVSPSRKQIHPREDQGEEGQGPADEVRRRDTEMVEGEPGEGRSDDHGQVEADEGESANEESALSEAWLEASDQEPLRDYGAHPYESEEEGV